MSYQRPKGTQPRKEPRAGLASGVLDPETEQVNLNHEEPPEGLKAVRETGEDPIGDLQDRLALEQYPRGVAELPPDKMPTPSPKQEGAEVKKSHHGKKEQAERAARAARKVKTGPKRVTPEPDTAPPSMTPATASAPPATPPVGSPREGKGPGPDSPEVLADRTVEYFTRHDPVKHWRAHLSQGGAAPWAAFDERWRTRVFEPELRRACVDREAILEFLHAMGPVVARPLSAMPFRNMVMARMGWLLLMGMALGAGE